MSYRLHDEIESGDADGELSSRPRHGAHSSDRLSTEPDGRRYTYQRPVGSSGRSRHAAPDDADSSGHDHSPSGLSGPSRLADPPAGSGAPGLSDTERLTPYSTAAADVEVPVAPPSTERRPLFGRSHVGVRIAAVAVLVLGSAVGVAVGVLRDSEPDTVKVDQDIQANVGGSRAPTPDTDTALTDSALADTAPTEAASVDAELLIKQRQQQALDAAKTRAATKAAAARAAAALTAKRAKAQRASRSENRNDSNENGSENGNTTGNGNGTGTGTGTGKNGSTGENVPSVPVDCKSYSGNRATGCALLQEFNFATTQMDCLDKLWTRESQWSSTAENSSSGAFGIPQALPGSKMASVADDWRTNPATQIRWGLNYIKGRYSSPCAAWAHSEANNWY